MAQSYQVDIVTRVVGASKIAQLDKALDQLAKNEQKVDTAARKATASTNTLGSSVQTAGTKAKASATGFKSMGTAINAAAAKITIIIGAVQTFSQVLGAAFARQNAEKRLQNLTGSTAEYEAALLSAAAVSQKFGISQTEATQALGDVYSRLSGVGFGLKEVTTIYEGFNTVARESGISSEAASSAFLQLGQALGSGVLQGDEMRSILEQMPQLTQMIAAEMGIAASQVKKFGSEGKVTSDIIYSALEKAASGATNLNGKLTPAQQSMNNFNVALDKASVALGTALIPALTGLMEAITPVISAVGTLIQKLDQLGASKIFEFLMSPARIFGELVNGAADNTEDLSTKAGEAVQQFSSLPGAAEAAKEPIESLAGATKTIADNSKTAVTEQGKLKAKVSETVEPTKELAKQNLEIEKQLVLQKQVKEELNGKTGEAVAKTQQVAQGEAQAAQNAQQLAQNQAGANAQIAQGAAEASSLANELQRAAAASAGIGGGSFIGSSTSANHSGKMYDKFKVVDGKIVETTQEEREAQMNQAKVNTANQRWRQIQAWDAAFEGTDYHRNAGAVRHSGGMIGPVGSQMSNAYMSRYGSNDMDRYQDNLAELSPMATGGYVTAPTAALVGEGGEPEYIIPRSKLRGAMERYSAGIRGERMIPDAATTTSGGSSASESSDNGYKDVVNNITYSGAVMNFSGSEWISKADLPGLLNKATKQTLMTLATSARARLEAGIK